MPLIYKLKVPNIAREVKYSLVITTMHTGNHTLILPHMESLQDQRTKIALTQPTTTKLTNTSSMNGG
ncbi:MAG: hypothetical protein WBE34_08665 [Candidatus Nitrosopolaris sp.]